MNMKDLRKRLEKATGSEREEILNSIDQLEHEKIFKPVILGGKSDNKGRNDNQIVKDEEGGAEYLTK